MQRAHMMPISGVARSSGVPAVLTRGCTVPHVVHTAVHGGRGGSFARFLQSAAQISSLPPAIGPAVAPAGTAGTNGAV